MLISHYTYNYYIFSVFHTIIDNIDLSNMPIRHMGKSWIPGMFQQRPENKNSRAKTLAELYTPQPKTRKISLRHLYVELQVSRLPIK